MLTQVVWVDHLSGRPRWRFHLFPKLQVVERLRSHRWTCIQSFMKELTAFSRTVAGEKTPLALGRDGARSVEIAHAVYQTSQNGASVVLSD
jgi:predicted dehydrogenase